MKLCKTCNCEITDYKRTKFCSHTCKIQDVVKRDKYISSQKKYTEKQRAAKYTCFENYILYLIKHHKRKQYGLTLQNVLALLIKQDYKCALSGINLTHSEGSPYNLSIDRIHPKGTYEISNIQLVCRCLNVLRCDLPLASFIDMCKKVADNNA